MRRLIKKLSIFLRLKKEELHDIYDNLIRNDFFIGSVGFVILCFISIALGYITNIIFPFASWNVMFKACYSDYWVIGIFEVFCLAILSFIIYKIIKFCKWIRKNWQKAEEELRRIGK